MAPQNDDSESMQVQDLPLAKLKKDEPKENESRDETISEGSIDRIPVRLWVMHGAVMFGREFCYAMETALVTPVLLQIGLPEQYYSLTWFLSPILGLIFTPLIGSASDRCTLRWGRRRPFILGLCVGVLLGVALFLNGSVIGLAIGDVPENQTIGIVLTVLGVVVLDFCADATEGPIRAYLLDVADNEEQDMALNIHAFSAELLRLCLCHLLTWFSIIAEAVFYTDFMGQVIFEGDPKALSNSTELHQYNAGVQMGCWGLVIYAATAAVCSALLQKYLDNYDLSIKIIYILGTLGFSIGTAVMFIFPNVYVSMIMISTMGIVSMSISYCPYALLGQYHEMKEYIHHSPGNSKRGFGIDCAILSCQVYISQILVASALGAVVDFVSTVRVIPLVASIGSFLGFLTAAFLVIYPEVPDENKEEPKRQVAPDAAITNGVDPEKPLVLKLSPKGQTAVPPEVESESAV
ncbi:hypothetical protein GDO78_014350 [Eleutherodactylus coqui]|uniref:Solute carrier family 45 member 4 n=1 Tax=Eleutherodactylus coqui TaxID=57060 RepID=A0A8J6ELS1_ELECQ|nr:hypothetical protein GDO78_014350 [Eleutherodactylus coqui]